MRFGIFGKSGSGKTTVAKYFVDKGYFHIDLDVIGKEVIHIYPEIKDKIIDSFGPEFITGNEIDRKKLGERVFTSQKELDKLNNIFFGPIRTEALKRIRNRKSSVVDGAILFDIGLNEFMDVIIYTKTNRETALARLEQRDGLERSVLTDRLDKQSRYDVQELTADYIVETNGTVEELNSKLDRIYKELTN